MLWQRQRARREVSRSVARGAPLRAKGTRCNKRGFRGIQHRIEILSICRRGRRNVSCVTNYPERVRIIWSHPRAGCPASAIGCVTPVASAARKQSAPVRVPCNGTCQQCVTMSGRPGIPRGWPGIGATRESRGVRRPAGSTPRRRPRGCGRRAWRDRAPGRRASGCWRRYPAWR